jgi:hypothetical protein
MPKLSDKQIEFKIKTYKFGSAAIELLNTWQDLEGTEESELHLSQDHEDCIKCTAISKAFGGFSVMSFDEWVAELGQWIEEVNK